MNPTHLELQKIGNLQQQMLPQVLPRILGWEAAVHYEVGECGGGDYFDFLPISADRLGIVIADVSGHGPASAILTTMTRMLLHSCPMTSGQQRAPFCSVNQHCLPAPDVVLTHLNRVLVENTLDEQFMTMVYGILSLTSGAFQFSVAGHMPPWWWHSPSGKLAPLPDVGGLPLGVDADASFQSATIQMTPGDQLIFCTDGLTDTQDAAGRVFGTERLEAIIGEHAHDAADMLKSSLMRHLSQFRNGVALDDDLTLLILKRDVSANGCPSELFIG